MPPALVSLAIQNSADKGKGVNKMSKIEVSKWRRMHTVNMLEKISKYESVRMFNESYCTADNLQQRKIDGLGHAIAHYAIWDGLLIMKIFAASLEDANFHGECEKVREWIAKEESVKEMNTADFIKYWIDANENGTDEMSYGDLAELTHDTQVAIFGFCGCEDNGNDNNESPYGDCPKNSSSFAIGAA